MIINVFTKNQNAVINLDQMVFLSILNDTERQIQFYANGVNTKFDFESFEHLIDAYMLLQKALKSRFRKKFVYEENGEAIFTIIRIRK